MLDQKYIEINGCKHYLLQENLCFLDIVLIHDCDLKHPLGKVYRLKTVTDSPIRYIIQPDGSTLMFNVIDWCNKKNPFTKYAKSSKQFGRGTDERGQIAFVGSWEI